MVKVFLKVKLFAVPFTYERMYNFIFMVLEKMWDRFYTGEKIACSYMGILTWWHSLHLFALSWGPVLSVLMSIVSGIAIAVGNVVAIDYYKEHWKHRLFKRKKGTKPKSDYEQAA